MSVVVDEASVCKFAEDNNLVYEADRSTFNKLPRDAANKPEQHLPIKYASTLVQTVDSTIYKLQHSTDVKDVQYWSRLPQTVATEFLHIIHPQTRRYLKSSEVYKLQHGMVELSSVIDKSMIRCAAPRSIKLREPRAPTLRNSDDESEEEKRKFYTEIRPYFLLRSTREHSDYMTSANRLNPDINSAYQALDIDADLAITAQDLTANVSAVTLSDNVIEWLHERQVRERKRLKGKHNLHCILKHSTQATLDVNSAPYLPMSSLLAVTPSHVQDCTCTLVKREFDVDDRAIYVTQQDLADIESLFRATLLMVSKGEAFNTAQTIAMRQVQDSSMMSYDVRAMTDAQRSVSDDIGRTLAEGLMKITFMRRREMLELSDTTSKKQLLDLMTGDVLATSDMFPSNTSNVYVGF